MFQAQELMLQRGKQTCDCLPAVSASLAENLGSGLSHSPPAPGVHVRCLVHNC